MRRVFFWDGALRRYPDVKLKDGMFEFIERGKDKNFLAAGYVRRGAGWYPYPIDDFPEPFKAVLKLLGAL